MPGSSATTAAEDKKGSGDMRCAPFGATAARQLRCTAPRFPLLASPARWCSTKGSNQRPTPLEKAPPAGEKSSSAAADAADVFTNPYERYVARDAAAGEGGEQQQQQGETKPSLTPEQLERKKDEATLSLLMKLAAMGVVSLGVVYFASDYAKKLYFGREGSAKVSVETRGRPALGGPFTLVTTKGVPVSQAEFLGKWTFFYFGFTHCPEICPVELNRMSKVVDAVRKARPDERIVPLFVSCDPRRDSLEAIEEYLSVFHPDFIGLVGTPKQVDEACRSYRIYYSVPDDKAMQEDDYLIDHSIAIFLFDPQGRFVDFFGNRYDESEIATKVLSYMDKLRQDPTWTNW